MYQYSPEERSLLKQRATQFKGQIARFREQTLDPEFFQQLRLRNGLYQELWSHMLRVAIPYGCLSSTQLHALADIGTNFDKGFGHFTTRQNIQFNWPELDDVPEILAQLADVDMHAIQTSGSCIRNISCDHLAGVAKDEIADPRPWCEIIRQWAVLHPEFNWLPRKFKFSVSGASEDRAVLRMNDIGLHIVHQDDTDTYFDVYVGGGMGRTPLIGKLISKSLPGASLLAYIEAIIRVYNQHGRRDHKYRSRIKILVNDLGLEEFKTRVEAEVVSSAALSPKLDKARLRALKASFAANHLSLVNVAPPAELPVNDPDYLTWLDKNTCEHKNSFQRIVTIPLKTATRAPGDLSSAQMHALADLADEYSQAEIRVSHVQNLILPQVNRARLYALWKQLDKHQLAVPNNGSLTDIIACPGLDFCSLANTTTLDITRQINQRFKDLDELYDLGPIRLNISGCMNSCAHHHVADIGVLGVDKKGEQWYQITLGGQPGIQTVLGKRIGPAIDKTRVVAALEQILQVYTQRRKAEESFIDCVNRTGIQPFKESVYERH